MKEKILNILDLLENRSNCDLDIKDVSDPSYEGGFDNRAFWCSKDNSFIRIGYPQVWSADRKININYIEDIPVTAEELYTIITKVKKIILNYYNDLLDFAIQEISEN